MKRIYATPLAFKQSVEQRLKTEALDSGTDLHRLRQLLVFDRFLARLFAIYEDAVVVKGGLSIELRLERARTTKDIDLRLVGDPGAVLPRFQAAGRIDLGDYLVYEVQPDRRHHEIQAAGMAYTGLRYRVETRLAGKPYGAPFGVDVAFAEPLQGEVDVV